MNQCKLKAEPMDYLVLSKDNTEEALAMLGDEEDHYEINVGDYIIKDPKGMVFICPKEEFTRLFTEV